MMMEHYFRQMFTAVTRARFRPRPITSNTLTVSAERYTSTDYSSHLSSKSMLKLLNKRGAKTKRKWFQPHVAEPLESIGKRSGTLRRGMTEAQRTRARQLSHVLYDKITQLVHSGELSQLILDKQVLILRVKMNPDFGGVNVYWDAARLDADEVQQLLASHEGKLRSLLISYHVLGRIPPVNFVKDRGRNSQGNIDQLLEIADYGDDYFASSQRPAEDHGSWRDSKAGGESQRQEDNVCHLKPLSLVSHMYHPSGVPHVKNDQVADSGTLDSQAKEGLKFRNDLYGLPHGEIMKKVINYKTKSLPARAAPPLSMSNHVHDSDRLTVALLDKTKLKKPSFKDSTKVKQRRLERELSGSECDGSDIDEL